jgi:C4-dicarboxylate-specific signal transduction histidine kinase
MRKFWALPLRRQLFVASLLLLVPVLITAVWSVMTTFRERTVELAQQADIVARTTASYVNRDVSELDKMAQRLTNDPAARALDPDAARTLFSRVIVGRSAVLRLALARADGSEVATVDSAADTFDGGRWATDAVRANGRVLMPMRTSGSGSLRYVVLAYPVRDARGLTIGALAVFINLRTLDDAFVSLPLQGNAVVTISSLEGVILARSGDAERYVGMKLPGPTRTAVQAPYEAAGIDGVNRIHAEALADIGPWLVSVGIPMSLAVDRAASLWSRSFAILGLGLAGWLVVAFVLSRRLGDAVSHLDATAQRIAAGDFSPMKRQAMFSREFAELQSAFDSMLQRFNATRHVLDEQMAEERRIRQELESLQGQVIRQERLAAVGQLVSGVAHEINNPLQAILGFAELLQMQSDVPDGVKSDLRLIQKESARACGIIRNLALFARQQPGAAAPVRLIDVISSVAELRQRRLESEDIELQVEDRSSQHVMAVLTELQQVVLNFVVNAEQAILGSGRLPGRITIRTLDRDERVILEVEDTGAGVKPEDEAKLFQPFFTTKPVGQGTGLGLSISYGIIDSLGGQIGYRRAPAGGSIFYFELPTAGGRMPPD